MKVRHVRTCPLCGENRLRESLTRHLRETHENDFMAVCYQLWKALHKALNRPKRKENSNG
jgi:hypothetical protein